LAVTAVILYHGYPKILTGGFIGVDIFFVISGFLISRNIFMSLGTGSFTFTDFYGRRIRRIFPALTVVLIACLAYGFLVLLPSELAVLALDVAGGAGFVLNLLFWHEAGYFDQAEIYKPLLHLWSLAVEEQFYIFWPFALWTLSRWRITVPIFLVVTWLLSIGTSISIVGHHGTADFYFPITRLWELDSGAILAWVSLNSQTYLWRNSKASNVISYIGLALILYSAKSFNHLMPFPGALALLPVLGSVLLIAAGPKAHVNRTLLAARPVVFVGVISYPLYLWHWPLISYSYIIDRGRPLHGFLVLCLIALATFLAWLTYRFVERPFRFGSNGRFNTLTLLASVLVIGSCGLVTYETGGFPARYQNPPELSITKINAAMGDGIFNPTSGMNVHKVDGITVARIGTGSGNVLFIGDSVVFQYGPRVQYLFDTGQLHNAVYFLVGPHCAPVPGVIQGGLFANCNNLTSVVTELVAEKHFKTIIVGANWAGYEGMTRSASISDFYANLKAEVDSYVHGGSAVYLILAPVSSQDFDPNLMVKRSAFGFSIKKNIENGVPLKSLIDGSASVNRELLEISETTGSTPLNPLQDVCGDGPFCSAFFDNGSPKFVDNLHLRPSFVATHITLFDPILTQ